MNTYAALSPQTKVIPVPVNYVLPQQALVLTEALKLFKKITSPAARILSLNSNTNNDVGYLSTDLLNHFLHVASYYFDCFDQQLGEGFVFDPQIQKVFQCFKECSGIIRSLPLSVDCQKDDLHFINTMLIERYWNELRGRALVDEKTMTKAILKTSQQVKDQQNTVNRFVAKLLREHQQIDIHQVDFKFDAIYRRMSIPLQLKDEQQFAAVVRKFINMLKKENLDNLHGFAYQISKDLNGQYYGRVFAFTDVGHLLKHPTLDELLRFNLLSQELWVDLKIALICEQAFLVETNSVVGASWSYQDWSKYFKSIIEPMKMHYYSSKVIRPDYKLMIF